MLEESFITESEFGVQLNDCRHASATIARWARGYRLVAGDTAPTSVPRSSGRPILATSARSKPAFLKALSIESPTVVRARIRTL